MAETPFWEALSESRKVFGLMKRTYQTSVCQTICMAKEDILILSTTLEYVEYDKCGSGDYFGGAVMKW